MRIRAAIAVMALAFIWGVPAAQAQITVTLVPGNFTYQFADPVTGAPISNLNFTAIGQTQKVALYLLQTGGTPPNLLQQLGAESLGVRLIYSVAAGTQVVRVPGGTQASINANVTANAGFDFVQRDASSSNPPSSSSATHVFANSANTHITESLLANPVSFTGADAPG